MFRRTKSLAAAIAIAGLALAGCSQSSPTDQGQSNAGAELRTGQQYDPKAFTGSTLKVLLIEHPFVASLKPLLPGFEAQTGIKVELEVLNEQQGFDKLQADLSASAGNYDVFMTDPLHNWQYAAANWVEPLDGYVGNPAVTAPDYNADDFVPGIYKAGRWNREMLKGLGEGQLWALPINYESYNLTYRPSMLKAAGVEVPTTYDEVLAATKKLKSSLGPNQHPVVTRFDKYWDLTYLTFGSMAQSYGVELLDESGNVAIATDASVAATDKFIDIVKAGSPKDASAFTWYEALQGMASGRFALALNEADLFSATYENKKESAVSEDVGYAALPEGPEGRKASAWIWQVSMNSASEQKGAAWTFMQWLTSAPTLLKTHLNGNMNPVRSSSWKDPELSKLVDSWGETPGQYRKVVEETAKIAEIRYPPHPELTRALDIWAEAIQKSFFDGNTKANLTAAQDEISSILRP
jgi:multiple sugar transport system substrate-binding protein